MKIETKIIKYARNFQIKKIFPAAVIGASISNHQAVAKTGLNPSDPLFGKLRERLLRIGNLFEKLNGNIIGCCAEVTAANKILFLSPSAPINKIIFTEAIRPRTMQKIKTCKNCQVTFN